MYVDPYTIINPCLHETLMNKGKEGICARYVSKQKYLKPTVK